MTLILASPAQAPVLAALHEAAFPPLERWDAPAFAAQLQSPGVFALLDLAGGFVLARVASDEAEILTLAVAPEVWRRGIARRLLQGAEARARDMGAIAMLLEVAEANAPARALYETANYVAVGRRPRYYRCGGTALIMRHEL